MQRFGLVGETLSYSYSKIIHEFLAEEFDISLVYELIEIEELSDLNIESYDGLNVTIPYKTEIMTYLHYIDEDAKNLNCVNTIDHNLKGYNTDIYGIEFLFEKVEAKEFDNIVVLGTGAMAQMIKTYYSDKNVQLVGRNTDYNLIDGEVLINATPISMNHTYDELLVEENYIKRFKAVIDLNYNPTISRFTNTAASAFIPNTNGLDMLIIQAIKSFEIWHDVFVCDEVFNKLRNYILKMMNPNVAIIGMPLSGKTTKFSKDGAVDLDAEIEKVIGITINDFIEFMGIEEFRKIETIVLNDILLTPPKLLVLGGGSVLDFENRLILKDYQILYYDIDFEQIRNNYLKNEKPRAIIDDENHLKEIYDSRKQYYNFFKTGDYNENSRN